MKYKYCYKCGTKLIKAQKRLETFNPQTGKPEIEKKLICPNTGTPRKFLLGMIPYGETGCYRANFDRMDLCPHKNAGLNSCSDCGACMGASDI